MVRVRRLKLRAAVTSAFIVALGASLAVQSEALGAGKPLGSVVLTKTFPGMVASAPGTTNGPVGDAGLHYLPVNRKSGNTMLEYIILRRVTGYVRAFSREPVNGDGVFIFAFRYEYPSEEVSWLRGFDSSFNTSGVVKFGVPGIKGASGFSATTSTSVGTPVVEYVVSFDVGLTTFIVITGTSSRDLTMSDAISLAKAQAAHS
jgi:hypothetical protein